MLIRAGRARAGLAADTGKALIVQGVIRHVEHADVVPDLLRGPVRQRVKLQKRLVLC